MNRYRVAFISLGCAKNLVNTEQMMALVQEAGHILVEDPAEADVAVLNTCGFIDSAKSEAIENILQLANLKTTGFLRKLIVTGCLPQRYQNEILKELPEVDGILGTGSYTEIVPAIERAMRDEIPAYFGNINRTEEEGARLLTTPGYMAYLKIAEGCSNWCAFCIIPALRGRYRSRPMAALLEEAGGLAKAGVQELIVIAQDITRYGTDWDGKHHLAALLRALCRIDGFRWIRLHYLYPDDFDDELIDTIAEEPKILPYLDIPIQHCNDRILSVMNRRGTKQEIRALFADLRARIPGLVLRTSLICGLPGEGEEEFEELCAFLNEVKIERAGVFQYSAEEGTPAARMEQQVPDETAARRVELIVDLQSRIMDEFNESRLGEIAEVLCEGFDPEAGCFRGRTYADSPEIDGHVYFTAAGQVPAGSFVPVLITDTTDDGDLMGEIADCEEE